MSLVYIAACPNCEWKNQKLELPSSDEQEICACCGKPFAPQWQTEEHEDPPPEKFEEAITGKPPEALPPTEPQSLEVGTRSTAGATVQQPPFVPITVSLSPEPLHVIVKDFEMSIESMVRFMLKWLIAAILLVLGLAACAFILFACYTLLTRPLIG